MTEHTVRPALSYEIRGISDWFLEERSKYPGMSRLVGRGLRGWMVRNVATPRYLRRSTNTFVLEQDGQMAGFAVVEQAGQAIHLADFAIRDGFDRAGLVAELLSTVEGLARDRDYEFVRATPWDSSDTALDSFFRAGFELLDYYLWVFTGAPAPLEAPEDISFAELPAGKALERRLHYLRQELDAAQVAGRDLIEGTFFPRRPPTQRAYRVDLAAAQGGEPREIGYLSPRPDERGDGVVTLVVSLDPAYWGTEIESRIVSGFVAKSYPGQPVRLLIGTSLHADRAEEGYRAIGLGRVMDLRPVLYKRVGGEPVAAPSSKA